MITNVITTPAESFEVVSLVLAKQQLRIEEAFTQDDDLIQAMIDAAVQAAQDYMGCQIIDSDVVMNMEQLQKAIDIPVPVREVSSLKYFTEAGVEITMPETDYKLLKFGKGNIIQLTTDSVPSTATRYGAVTIAFKTGYETGEVPKPIIQAVLLQISDMYDRREDRIEVPLTASSKLLRPYKQF